MDKKPRNILVQMFEWAVLFCIASYLVRLGFCFLTSVWPGIITLLSLVVIGVVAYRVIKHRNDQRW